MARDRLAAIRRLELEANALRREMGLPEWDYDAGIEQVPPREWGLGDGIEHDMENDGEHIVKVGPDANQLIIVGLDGQQVAGIDFRFDRVDFGVWREDGDWDVLVSVDGKTGQIDSNYFEP